MDRTKTFQQLIGMSDNPNYLNGEKSSSIVFNKNGSHFNTKLRELVSSITYMRDYLISNKKDYINIYSSLLSMASKMTDDERDQIDRDVQDFVKLCNDVCKILRVEIKSRISKQQFEHESIAISLVEAYIKSVYDYHNKQKAIRLKRNLESHNFFRLSRSWKNNNKTSDTETNNKKDENSSSTMEYNDNNKSSQKEKSQKSFNKNFLDDYTEDDINNLSPEEQKVFKLEGNRIYEEMNSMSEEVKNVTKKLTEISKLQEVFFEHILKQDSDLSHLNNTTIMSTEYIREGNEQLREAMRKNAGFRVWILFFVTTLAFVILFLDWYNS